MTEAPPDALLPNPDLPIRLPVFEGPLDLLLFLIRRNEIDIYDIPIESVTHQYLAVIRQMEQLSLEIAGDFFVMAATLMYIKSRMLLPTNEQIAQPEEEVEEADPRWELVQQLLEYKRFKEAAAEIRDLVEHQQDFMPRVYIEATDQLEARPVQPSDRIELWNTFNLVLRRLAEKITQGEIHDDNVTISDRMEFLLEKLTDEPKFRFSQLFEDKKFNLNFLVATFLACLELTRLKRMYVTQDETYGEILLERRDTTDDPPPDPSFYEPDPEPKRRRKKKQPEGEAAAAEGAAITDDDDLDDGEDEDDSEDEEEEYTEDEDEEDTDEDYSDEDDDDEDEDLEEDDSEEEKDLEGEDDWDDEESDPDESDDDTDEGEEDESEPKR